jgi:tryptophan halogenase
MATAVREIVIVGGGTAGWMTAAGLASVMHQGYRIRVVESSEIGIIGVGEATIPAIKLFNTALGLDEDAFLRQTQGTFKLGIEFANWGRLGDSYIHGFGPIGRAFGALSCHQYWLKHRLQGGTSVLDDYSINTVASRRGKYMRSRADMRNSPLADIENAFHFDASLYGQFLRSYAQGKGVLRTEGTIVDVRLKPENGFIDALVLASGEVISGDFFVDCSGMRALLIGQALQEPYENWSHWLPCDRAVAVQCESAGPPSPYTRSTARSAGWQWRIPLQHRIGNGHVFSSNFMSEDEATSILLSNLDAPARGTPRVIPFAPGRRRRTWVRNCVAVGLAAGFFEPIESTNIHLVQTAVQRLIQLFPTTAFEPMDTAKFNEQTQQEYERIRDFVILHYKATERDDSPCWNHCRNMEVPQTLMDKIDLFKASGRFFREQNELFIEPSWVQVMVGQRILPRAYHPLVDTIPAAETEAFLADMRQVISKCVDVMPPHAQFIAEHCAAAAPV